MDAVPNLPKCPVPVLMSCYLTEVSGTGIDVVPAPVPRIFKSGYRNCRYRYPYSTELTEVSGTGMDVVPVPVQTSIPVLAVYVLSIPGISQRYSLSFQHTFDF